VLLIAAGQLAIGCYFIKAGFGRRMREARRDEAPVIRSDKVDGYLQIACFVLGALCIVTGLFMLAMLVPALS
jgi:hypothetical protein